MTPHLPSANAIRNTRDIPRLLDLPELLAAETDISAMETMATPEPTDDTRRPEEVSERVNQYVEDHTSAENPHLEQTREEIRPGAMLVQTDVSVQQIDPASASVSDLVSALTSDVGSEAIAVNVYVSSQEKAGDIIAEAFTSEILRQTAVQIYAENQGSYRRYIPAFLGDASRSVVIYTGAMVLFSEEFLVETVDETEFASFNVLYEQFCWWCRNVTGTPGPSQIAFDQLLAAEGLELSPR